MTEQTAPIPDITTQAACARFLVRLESRQRPPRVVRRALVRARQVESGDVDEAALDDALAACTFVALALGILPPWANVFMVERAPRLRAPETYLDDAITTLERIAETSARRARDARWLIDAFCAAQEQGALCTAQSADAPELHTSAVLPLFPDAVTMDAPSTAIARVPPSTLAHYEVVRPFDDPRVVEALRTRIAEAEADDLAFEIFAALGGADDTDEASDDEVRTLAKTSAREAYALAALLAVWSGRMPPRFSPDALRQIRPIAAPSPTALELACSVLSALELRNDTFAGSARLRMRALARLLKGRDW